LRKHEKYRDDMIRSSVRRLFDWSGLLQPNERWTRHMWMHLDVDARVLWNECSMLCGQFPHREVVRLFQLAGYDEGDTEEDWEDGEG